MFVFELYYSFPWWNLKYIFWNLIISTSLPSVWWVGKERRKKKNSGLFMCGFSWVRLYLGPNMSSWLLIQFFWVMKKALVSHITTLYKDFFVLLKLETKFINLFIYILFFEIWCVGDLKSEILKTIIKSLEVPIILRCHEGAYRCIIPLEEHMRY